VRGIRQYLWGYDNAHVLYLQDKGGDESWQLHSVDVGSKKDLNLTPVESIPGPDGQPIKAPNGHILRPSVQIDQASDKAPDEVLIGLNTRNPQLHDLYRVNIKTGEMKMVIENTGFAGYVTDDDYKVRFAERISPKAEIEVLKPAGKTDDKGAPTDWAVAETIPMEDAGTTNILGFDATGRTLYLTDSRGRNTSALFARNLDTGESKLLAEDARADVGGALIHPKTKAIQAVSAEYDRTRWIVIDKAVQPDLDYLKTVCAGDIRVTSRSLDDSRWIIACVADNGPVRYYRYDRTPGAAGKATFLFTNRKALEGLTLASMRPVVIKSRDGLDHGLVPHAPGRGRHRRAPRSRPAHGPRCPRRPLGP